MLDNFNTNEYLEDSDWIVYITEDELACDPTLSLINYYTTMKIHKPFRIKVTKSCVTLVDDLMKLEHSVKYFQGQWFKTSFYHLRWLRTITDQKLPIICHTMFRSRKVFSYLLYLNPRSVLEGLDEVNTPFNFAMKHKYSWYFKQMIKKLLTPWDQVKDKMLTNTQRRFNTYYKVYFAIMNSRSSILQLLSISKCESTIVFILKILWKCEQVFIASQDFSHLNFYKDLFLESRLHRVSSFIVRRKLLDLSHDLYKIIIHCIRYCLHDALEMILFQAKEQGYTHEKDDNDKWSYCSTPLLYSINFNNFEAMKILIKYGALENLMNHELMFAIDLTKNNYFDRRIVYYLIESGVDINYRLTDGFHVFNWYNGNVHTALEMACRNGDEEIIEMLLRKTDVHDDDGKAFHLYLDYLVKNHRKDEIQRRSLWWRKLRSLHVIDTFLLCSNHVLNEEEEAEEKEDQVMRSLIYNTVFEVYLETICEMI